MSDLTTLTISRAVADVWAGPQQDRQLTFIPSRMSTSKGALNTLRLPWGQIEMPVQGRRFVIYEMGQVGPQALGFDEMLADWSLLSDVAQRQEMVVCAHINSRVLRNGSIYIKRNRNRNLIIAVDHTDFKDLLESDFPLYFRMYSNLWFNTTAGAASSGIKILTKRIETPTDASNFQVEYNGIIAENTGNVFCYVNGVYRDELTASDMAVGSVAEILLDYSGVGHFDVPIKDLKHFESTMDKKRKYIIQQPDNGRNNIDYFDDLEIYICTPSLDGNNNPVNIGVYYPHVMETNTRQLTHRDYSIESLLVKNIMLNQVEDITYKDSFIRVFLREGDNAMPPIMDGQYVKDLYLLDKEERLDLMVGTNSVIPQWNVRNLESSQVSKWMNTAARDLTIENLRDVYSYHGIQSLIEAPKVNGSVAELPPIMHKGGLVFMYNADGLLVETRTVNSSGNVSLPVGVTYVETVPGIAASGGKGLEHPSVQSKDPVSDYAQELVYKDSSGAWHLAVEGDDYTYDLVNRVVNWNSARFADTKIKRLAGRYYTRDIVLSDTEMTTKLPIFENNDVPLCNIPIGRLDVWINGKKGIRNLDYVDEYPNFRVLNRNFYNADTINVKILFHGLSEDRARNKIGILKHRLLTYNESYDISHNRIPEIIVKGMVTDKTRVDFSETRTGNMEARYPEGSPYSVDYFVSHIPQADLKLLSLSKSEELALNKRIEDYFTVRFPEEPIDANVVIPEKYSVTSALMHALIEDILNGTINITYDEISDSAVAAICAPYLYIRNADLISKDWVDWDYVDIHPSGRVDTITINQRSYAFLRAVNRLYLDNRTNLNGYINVL